MYLNRENKERMVALLILNAVYQQFIQQEDKMKKIFGVGWRYFKQSRTLLVKSLESACENLGPDTRTKLHNVAKYSDYVVVSKYAPKDSVKATVGVDVDALYDLASIAIGKECTGCTKCDYKKCHVFQALDKSDIPAVQEVKNDCPYRQ